MNILRTFHENISNVRKIFVYAPMPEKLRDNSYVRRNVRRRERKFQPNATNFQSPTFLCILWCQCKGDPCQRSTPDGSQAPWFYPSLFLGITCFGGWPVYFCRTKYQKSFKTPKVSCHYCSKPAVLTIRSTASRGTLINFFLASIMRLLSWPLSTHAISCFEHTSDAHAHTRLPLTEIHTPSSSTM